MSAPKEQSAPALGSGPRPLPAEAKARIPLSFGQEAFFRWQQANPRSPVWNFIRSCTFTNVDHATLELAVTEVTRRHESLRASFVVRDGAPCQVIAPPQHVQIPRTRVTGAAGRTPDEEVVRIARDDIERMFDFENGPLYRWRLLELEDHQILIFVAHHLIVDGAGMILLFTELHQIYGALRSGTTPALPPLEVEYSDFAIWERMPETLQATEPHVSYWTKLLEGAKPRSLTAIFPDDVRSTTTQTRLRAGDLVRSLEKSARDHGFSLFAAVVTALAVALQAMGLGEDILIAVPVANRRTFPDAKRMVACLVDRLIVRVDLSGTPTFRELLARTSAVVVDGKRKHESAPSVRVLERFDPSTPPYTGDAPFSAVLNIQPPPPEDLRGEDGFRYPHYVWPVQGHPGGYRQFTDLFILLTSFGAEQDVTVGGTFSPELIARLATTLKGVMARMVDDLDGRAA